LHFAALHPEQFALRLFFEALFQKQVLLLPVLCSTSYYLGPFTTAVYVTSPAMINKTMAREIKKPHFCDLEFKYF